MLNQRRVNTEIAAVNMRDLFQSPVPAKPSKIRVANIKALMLMAAMVNSRYGHATPLQMKLLRESRSVTRRQQAA